MAEVSNNVTFSTLQLVKRSLPLCFEQPRRPSKKHPAIRASTADEAIEKMLEQKKISTKINYDVLKDLVVKPGSSPAGVGDSPKVEPPAPRTPACTRRPAPTRTALSLSKPLSTLGKR